MPRFRAYTIDGAPNKVNIYLAGPKPNRLRWMMIGEEPLTTTDATWAPDMNYPAAPIIEEAEMYLVDRSRAPANWATTVEVPAGAIAILVPEHTAAEIYNHVPQDG